ncbi:MAG: ATP-binding protein [Bacilli bacterium]|nr:ATP-binding protein [Bacilli bacterium]
MDNVKDKIRDLNILSSLDDEEMYIKMKQAYLDCPKAIKYLKDLGVPDDVIEKNIVKVYDLVKDLNYCSKCPGIENCKKDNPLLITKLVYHFGFLERELTPCKRVLDKVEIEGKFRVRDFDDAWIANDLSLIDQTKARKEVIKKYVNYLKDVSDEWIFINGEANTGRSYLAASIAVDIARQKKGPLCFMNSALRFKELNDLSYSNKRKFQEMLDLYSTCQVLVIDDFGSEYKNDFVRDAILMQIIIKRSAKKLFTIFTSDYSIEQIETLYSVNKIAQIQAERIFKIIRNECKKEISLGDVGVY